MGNEERLNEEALQNVTGGKGASPDKRSQFEAAWKMLGMTEKGFSGMRMAELYDDWEFQGFKPDAVAFLSEIIGQI